MSTSAGAISPTIDPARAYRKWQASYYPNELWWAVGSVVGLAVLLQLFNFANTTLARRSARRDLAKPKAVEMSPITVNHHKTRGSGRRALRNLPSATLAFAQVLFFRVKLPFYRLHHMNIAEMALSVGYLAALLIWSFVKSHDLTVTYWANRTAHLATSQTPLIVALAGKNNIISLLTGIGYEKINVLHRVAARSTLILIWAHAFGRWRIGLKGHFSLDEVDMRFGVVAMTAFTLATLLSIRPIRGMAYEVFLIWHIILVAMYLIFGLFHVPEVKYRFWPALMIWALDRTLRAIRIIVLNKLWVNIFPVGELAEKATLERVSGDTVRLTVRRSLKWTSGQHAFLVAPSVAALPFEAHPFTIASSCATIDASDPSKLHDLVFIIRARDGFTKRLLEASKTTQNIPVCVDGPYGKPPSLSHYSTCIFFAGGSGVSYTLPLLLDIVRQVRSGHAVTQRVLFLWTIRDRSHMDWISHLIQEALRECPPTLQLDIRIHVTQPTIPTLAPDEASSSATSPIEEKPSPFSEKGSSTISLESFQSVKILSGRPEITALLDEELGTSAGQVSIDVSGPTNLANGVRDALVACETARPSSVLRGTSRTTLHVEASDYEFPKNGTLTSVKTFGW